MTILPFLTVVTNTQICGSGMSIPGIPYADADPRIFLTLDLGWKKNRNKYFNPKNCF
jgi:hypothetical protein